MHDPYLDLGGSHNEVPCLNPQAFAAVVSVVPAKEPNDTAAAEDRKDHNASSWAIQLTNMNQTCLPP